MSEPHPVVVGVNVVNPQWQPRGAQDAALDALQRAGVRVIRIPLVPPTGGTYDGTIEYISRAAARGMRVLLIVYPLYRPDAAARPLVPGEPEMWSLPPLSAADPLMLATTYGPVLRRLDALGIELAGIEFGNEINWTAFNGEFPIPGRGIVLGFDDLERDRLGRRIAAGYRAYLASLAALKRIRDGLVVNRRTPILAAGFADFGPAGQSTGRPLDAVNVGATLRYMRVHGLDTLVDGYSIHTYPDAPTAAQRAEHLARDVLAECGPPSGLRKPCWLTEWGFPDTTKECRADDEPRRARVEEFRNELRPSMRDGRVRALIYYAWGDGSEDTHGLTRCGSLMSGGRAALAPVAR